MKTLLSRHATNTLALSEFIRRHAPLECLDEGEHPYRFGTYRGSERDLPLLLPADFPSAARWNSKGVVVWVWPEQLTILTLAGQRLSVEIFDSEFELAQQVTVCDEFYR